MSGAIPTLAAFAAALDATRGELAAVNVKIDALQGERQQVELAPPHAEDIAEVFLRGLNEASDSFERQFHARLSDTYATAGGAAAVAANRTAHVLKLEPRKPDREELLTRSIKGQEPDMNMAALTYFLHSQIAQEIPALVDRLCPSARNGMRTAHRKEALREIDRRLGDLGIERDRLQGELSAARIAATGRSA